MDVSAESFAHFSTANIRNGVQCQAVVELEVVLQILAYAVNDEMEQLVLFVEEEGDGEVSNLLLRVLCPGDEVDGLEMAKVDIPSENVDVEKLEGVNDTTSSLTGRSVVPCRHIFFCHIRSICRLYVVLVSLMSACSATMYL
jgi:hypothetical protein